MTDTATPATVFAKAVKAYLAVIAAPVEGGTEAERRFAQGSQEDRAEEVMWEELYRLSPADVMSVARTLREVEEGR